MVKVIIEGSIQDVLDSIPDEKGKEEALAAFDSFLGYVDPIKSKVQSSVESKDVWSAIKN
jgi:hypothetical protein